MKLPLTPIRCLYRGVDLYGHKVRWFQPRAATLTSSMANAASAWPPSLLA